MPENNEKNTEKESQYKSILSDDDGTAPRPIRKKQRDPMAEVRREIEEQQRQQREKAELLKLRQGIRATRSPRTNRRNTKNPPARKPSRISSTTTNGG